MGAERNSWREGPKGGNEKAKSKKTLIKKKNNAVGPAQGGEKEKLLVELKGGKKSPLGGRKKGENGDIGYRTAR